MVQMVRLGQQYLNLAHVLGVTFGLHQWEDDEGEHAGAVAIVEMAATCGGVAGAGHAPVTYRFYGATVDALRAWLDERTTVIAEEAEECPEPVWAVDTRAAWAQEGEEDALVAEAEAADVRARAPAWTWDGPTIPF